MATPPAVLPADFFDKKKDEAPAVLPADFFDAKPSLPGIKPPVVDMKPEGSWLVRGLGALSSAYKPQVAPAGPAPLPIDADKPRDWTPDPNQLDKPMISLPEPDLAGPDAGAIEKMARGFGRAASKNIAALSTPRNVGIMGGLAAANLAGIAVPPLQPAVQALNATAATYFSKDMMESLPEQNAAYQDAVAKGDVEGATEALTNIGATATMAAATGRGSVEAVKPAAYERAGLTPSPIARVPMLQTPKNLRQEKWTDARQVRDTPFTEKPVEIPQELSAEAFQRHRERQAEMAKIEREAKLKAKADIEAAKKARTEAELKGTTIEDITAKTEQNIPSDKPLQRNFAEDPLLAPEFLDQKPAVTMGDVVEKTADLQAKGKLPEPTAEGVRRRSMSQRGGVEVPTGAEILTPEQKWADEYAAVKITEREATRKGIEAQGFEAFKEGVAKVKNEMVDSISPILDAVSAAEKKYKFEVRPGERFEYFADRALGARENAERFMRDNGLLDVIRTPEKLDRFDQFLIAKESVREAKNQGRETGRDFASDQRYVEAWKNEKVDPRSDLTYDQLSQKFFDYSSNLLDYSVDAGLISADMAKQWRQEYGGQHVPLSRVFTAIERLEPQGWRANKQVANLAKQTVFNKRKGSVRPIDNPVYEMMERTRAAFAQGERNKAARVLAGYRELPGMSGLIREFHPTPVKKQPKHSFSYLENGKKRTFETTPEIAAAAKSLDAQTLGWAAKIIGVPARIKRFFTTGVSLPFAAANVPVDFKTTLVTSKNARNTTLNPVVWGRALKAAVLHNGDWSKIESHGAGFTQLDLYRDTRQHTIDAIRATRSTKDMGKYIASHPIRSAVELLRTAEDIVSRSEQFGRARLFDGTKRAELAKRMPEDGFSSLPPDQAKAARAKVEADAEILAAIAANNELPNYRRSGNVTRAMNGAILYLNAGIQGSRNIARAIKDRPAETAAKVGLGLYLPVTMATLWNLSDPERKKIYDDIRKYEKDNNLIIVTDAARLDPKTNKYEGILKVKLAPGLSNLTVPVRNMIEQMHGEDPMSFAEIAEKLVGVVSPIEPNERGLASAIPQAVKPTIQGMANYDFFRGGPKVPRSLQDLPPEQQVLPNTSGTVRKAAAAVGVSPVKAEEFVKDTLGGSAPQIINAVDTVAATAGIIQQDEVGGANVLKSVTARFDEARAGEQDQRVYTKLEAVRDKAVNLAIAELQKDPDYKAIADKKQRLEVERKMASRVMSRITAMTSGHEAWDVSTPEQRIEALEAIDAALGGKSATRRYSPFPMLRK